MSDGDSMAMAAAVYRYDRASRHGRDAKAITLPGSDVASLRRAPISPSTGLAYSATVSPDMDCDSLADGRKGIDLSSGAPFVLDPGIDPLLEQRHRHRAGAQHHVVEGLEVELRAELGLGPFAQCQDRVHADLVG